MSENRDLSILLDADPFRQGSGFRLTGRTDLNLYPDLFLLQCRNLPQEAIFRLQNAKILSVMSKGSCLASGQISDVCTQTVPKGTVTTAAFSLGLDLWNAEISVSCPAGTNISDDIRAILEASGTKIQLLSFPGEDPSPLRGRAYVGKAAEAIAQALSHCGDNSANAAAAQSAGRSAACARGFLTPSGLKIIPGDPLPATLHLYESDLTDRPVFADSGRKLILNTDVIGFQPGEEMTLEFEGKTTKGLIVSRMVDADSYSGPWKTELLVEIH